MVDPKLHHSELVQKARSFLASPELKDADAAAKKEFLKSKGLQGDEVDHLLSATLKSEESIPPLLPPRTYPQAPQSRLPDLLSALMRITTLAVSTAGSASLLYYLLILPRLTSTLRARHSLKLEQLERLSRLSSSATNLEKLFLDTSHSIESQSGIPIFTVQDFKSSDESTPNRTYRDLVRAILHSSQGSRLSATEIISRAKEECFLSEEDIETERCIRRELLHSQFFNREDPEYDSADPGVIQPEPTYSIATPTTETEKLGAALERLNSVTTAHKDIISETSLSNSAAQKTLQSLSELTALVSSQTYSIPSNFRGSFGGSFTSRPQNTLGPAEEEVRKELRALKGLLLNRRTFASIASSATTLGRSSA